MPAPAPAKRRRPGIIHYQQYHRFINLYNAIAQEVLKYKDKRELLVKILRQAIPPAQVESVIQVHDRAPITKMELLDIYAQHSEWMNPFSFFAFFSTFLGGPAGLYGNWRAWMEELVGQLGINAALPPETVFPMAVHHPELYHPGNPPDYFSVLDGWLQTHYLLTNKDVVDRLWRLAEYATYKLPPNPIAINPNALDPNARQFMEDFNDIAPRLIMSSGLMSGGLNWMNPGVWVRANYTEYYEYNWNTF